MRSEYTSNGMHKDDPTNPQSHWNDWTIDRDGNKLKEDKPKEISEYTDEELKREINQRRIVKLNEGTDLILKGLEILKEIGEDKKILNEIYNKYK